MTPVAQTNYGRHQGNCLTACVASVLDVPISAVPEFCVDGEWYERLYNFCQENGFFLLYWKHSEIIPICCLNAYVILLLSLEGEEDLHAIVAKTTTDSTTQLPNGDTQWGWKSELVHDPNERGTPPVKEVYGYIMIGKQ